MSNIRITIRSLNTLCKHKNNNNYQNTLKTALISACSNHLNQFTITHTSNANKIHNSNISLSHNIQSRSFHNNKIKLAGGSSSALVTNADGSIDFNLADIGEGIAECEIIRWYIKPGDKIQQFDKVCEVQSDKANVEITSRYDGVVKELKYNVGQLAKVGKPLLTLMLDGAPPSAAAASQPQSTTPQPSQAKSEAKQPIKEAKPSIDHTSDIDDSNSKVLTSPAVRRIAKEEQVDLRLVTPTGPNGRILKEDVQNYIANGRKSNIAAKPQQPTSQRISSAAIVDAQAVSAPTPTAHKSLDYLQSDVSIPVTGLARIMVQTMSAANQVAQLGYSDEINVDKLVTLREQLKPVAEKQGIKLSYLPFIIKAVSLSLKTYPSLNAHTNADCSMVTHKAAHNIGIAMDTPRGLLVPNIKNVQSKSILEIATELQRLTGLGAAGKLGRDDLSGGTFTLSNIGTIGGTYMSPILVLPEVVIGAIGSIHTLPRYDSQMQVKPTKIMYMSWSADHRVVDGATIARFSNLWKSYLENPATIVLHTR